jgi:hypothetical protein
MHLLICNSVSWVYPELCAVAGALHDVSIEKAVSMMAVTVTLLSFKSGIEMRNPQLHDFQQGKEPE